MTISLRLLWQLCSAALLVLSLVQAQEQVVIAEPGLDGSMNHIQYSPSTEPNSHRHLAEKKRLLETLKRDGDKLAKDHPRYRLLQAMHGYMRHQERYIDQLEVWESSFLGLPEPQKKVSTSTSSLQHDI